MELKQAKCRNRILSNEYVDLLTDFNLPATALFPDNGDSLDYCEHALTEDIKILHVAASEVSPLLLGGFFYQYVPKCYGLLQDIGPLSESGILSVLGAPLELTGRNVIIGIVDTGIRYQLPLFRRSDGSSRILSIWDQTAQEGPVPLGFDYGTEYDNEVLNRSLEAYDSLRTQGMNANESLLVTDENGHGTSLASVAAGYDRESGFLGAAPGATLAVVKLKQAKAYLRNYYQIPFDVPCYQETDIMMALQYLEQLAIRENKPLVTCLALGTNQGAHDGSSLLNRYMDELGSGRSRCMVVGGGNEGNAGGHYAGGDLYMRVGENGFAEEAELLVGQGETGFCIELWGEVPGVYGISVSSPSGETLPVFYPGQREETYSFLYAPTGIRINSIIAEQGSGRQLIRLFFENPLQGIWRLRVYEREGWAFSMWLPMKQFLSGETYFLRSNPDITLTEPAYGRQILAVSSYNSEDGSFYLNSGRGFSIDGFVTPALAAPGVNIPTATILQSGSSMAAAFCAGAAACFLQWAVVERNDVLVNTAAVKNYFIRGTARRPGVEYPSKEWGYGTLNLERVFDVIAGIA